jgi:hypothetical protein
MRAETAILSSSRLCTHAFTLRKGLSSWLSMIYEMRVEQRRLLRPLESRRRQSTVVLDRMEFLMIEIRMWDSLGRQVLHAVSSLRGTSGGYVNKIIHNFDNH